MGLNATQFRDLVIRPTLEAIGGPQNSEAAVQLLLATALHESRLEFLKQHPTGPALGVYQMEPNTHDDLAVWIWNNRYKYLEHDTGTSLYERICWLLEKDSFSYDWLSFDLRYATVMTRLHYWRVPEALPEAGDAAGMAAYWKRYYNTPKGKGTEGQFLAAWERHEDVIAA